MAAVLPLLANSGSPRTAPAVARVARGLLMNLQGSFGIAMNNTLAGIPTRVLLVEDDDALRELLRLELEAAGYLVEAHRSAEDALRQQPKRAQLAVLDYRLPGIDGLELLKILKASQPGLPVLMVTSEPTELAYRARSGADVEAVIRKPFQIVSLLETLRAIGPHV